MKEILSKLLAAGIGAIVLGSLYRLVVATVVTLSALIFRSGLKSEATMELYPLLNVAVVIAGIYLGVRAYQHKNVWYSVFRPTKHKFFISVVLSLLSAVFYFGYIELGVGEIQSVFARQSMSAGLTAALVLLRNTIFYYPFGAVTFFIYKNRGEREYRSSRKKIIILLALLNPIFMEYAGSMSAIFKMSLEKKPCGARIKTFHSLSPAQSAGISVNDVIVRIDRIEVSKVEDVTEYMEKYKSHDPILVYTVGRTYVVQPVFREGRYWLGVNLVQVECERNIKP